MKQRTVNSLRDIAALTAPKCATCPSMKTAPHRCCDKAFCDIVKAGMERAGLPAIPTTGHQIPYMGEHGCVVPPEYRPGCAGYVCDEHLRDRSFRREWMRLHGRFAKDPHVKLMMAFDEKSVVASFLKEFT